MDNKRQVIEIGLYMPAEGLGKINMTNPENGNPGIGGTEYCFLLLAYYLALKKDCYSVTILSSIPLILPPQIKNCILSEFYELKGYKSSLNILILKTPKDKQRYDVLKELSPIHVITWSHNYLYANEAKMVYECPTIDLNVFVGKQMYDFYIDHNIIKKSTFIFNIVPDTLKNCNRNPIPYTATFIGQISESKGIIDLFKVWSLVEHKYPDAHLNIIGGGNLYDRNRQIGSLGITDEKTESKLKRFILDENGKLKKNIHFLGILGKEKYDVFLKSSVGIVNPSARTETFGLGIIEMATAKLPVVTRNWNGHPDTALNKKTALLGYSIRQMADNICTLFQEKELNSILGNEGKILAKRFSKENILPIWGKYIQDIVNNQLETKVLHISNPIINNYKFIRAVNSFFRFKLHLKFLPSIVAIECQAIKIIKKIKRLIR